MNAGRLTRIGMLFATAVSCIGCDQVTKSIATRELSRLPGHHSYLGDTFRLQYALNPGAFLGMGGGLGSETRFWSLTVINAMVLAILGYVLLARWNMASAKFAAGTLILSGGIGNLIDRVSQHGFVTDFLNLGFGPVLRTGVFNVADMAITGGFCIFAWVWWQEERASKHEARVGG